MKKVRGRQQEQRAAREALQLVKLSTKVTGHERAEVE
jgi:hypothetical protein